MVIFDRFDELTTHLLGDYEKVQSKIPILISENTDIWPEVSEYLTSLAVEFDSVELKNNCYQPADIMANISEKFVGFDRRIETLIVNCHGCSDCLLKWRESNPGQLELVTLDSRLTSEDRYISARFHLALSTRESTWKYFAALPSLALFQALASYRDLNLTFLGKEPGERIDTSGGIRGLLEAQADASIDAVTFNFGSALLQATNAAITSLTEEDVSYSRLADTKLERIFRLNDALVKLDARIHQVAAVLSIAEVAIANSISSIEGYGASFTRRLIEIGGVKPKLSS